MSLLASRLRVSLCSLLLASCCPAKPAATMPVPAMPVAVASPPPSIEDPAVTAYTAAQAEVARLKAEADQNPLLAPWIGPYEGVPPWDRAKSDAIAPAFTLGLQLLAAEIDVIAKDPAPPTFSTVFVPLQDVGRHQDRAETIFGVMTSSLNTPEVQSVERAWSPKLAAAYDAITFNSGLFAKIATVYDARITAGLTPQERRLVELTYDRSVSQGAKLDAAGKAKLGEINQQLATLFTEFSNQVLADEDTGVVLETKADLAGLSASLVASYKAAADERKLAGKWVVVNTRSSVDPFLAAASRRALREKVWKAFKNRGDNGGANDTNALITKIVALRAARATLLGYATHAHWRMSNTMAKDPAKAQDLMLRVWAPAVARVKQEVADMQAIGKRDRLKGAIEAWDYLFYAEKVRKAKYALDAEQLKPYFELNNMINASFWMAEQLYGLAFKEITGTVPVFHPDVRVWEVSDQATGKFRGLFYGDYFARTGKRSGAWASGYQGHETFTGVERTAITSNNNNFAKGAPGAPVLISLDDAQTLFHEFGHGLHGLLSEVNYPGLAGTPRDFVEYPSQVHEMWVMTRPVLDKFALHYQTKQPIPQALLDKVEASKRFNQGYATVEYLSSALVDMALHTVPAPSDADAFERDTLAKLGMPKEIAMRHRLPQFLHLFSSDSYSAGYYSYLWSEVMDADTRQAFQEAGNVFDPATAQKLRQFILAPGNTTDRAEAYRQFRGRDPDVKALLEKRGFPTN